MPTAPLSASVWPVVLLLCALGECPGCPLTQALPAGVLALGPLALPRGEEGGALSVTWPQGSPTPDLVSTELEASTAVETCTKAMLPLSGPESAHRTWPGCAFPCVLTESTQHSTGCSETRRPRCRPTCEFTASQGQDTWEPEGEHGGLGESVVSSYRLSLYQSYAHPLKSEAARGASCAKPLVGPQGLPP